MATTSHIKFDLIGNARDSVRQAVELIAWKDIGDPHSRLKHAIISSANAIELLLKEKLRQVNSAFVWENVDKYPSLDARTVGVDTAIARLKQEGAVALSDQDVELIKSLRRTRNAIEHYEWFTIESEAKVIVGNALSFAFTFANDELDIDLSSEFRLDDTWRTLIEDLYEFSKAHGARIEAKLEKQGKHPVCCDSCCELTVPMFGGSCELCGHWHDVDDI